MVSKSIKTFQKTLKAARPGGHTGWALQAPVELPYISKVYARGRDTAPSLLKKLRSHGDSEDVQATRPELPLHVWVQGSGILAKGSENQKLGEILAKPHATRTQEGWRRRLLTAAGRARGRGQRVLPLPWLGARHSEPQVNSPELRAGPWTWEGLPSPWASGIPCETGTLLNRHEGNLSFRGEGRDAPSINARGFLLRSRSRSSPT